MPVLIVLVLVVWYVNNPDGDTPQPSATGDGVVEQAHAERRSGVWVEVDGRVARLLADDNEGSRLVAHNIDLAERVPVRRDGRLRLRGRYEWNDRGGVIHWTHHDPDGSVAGGWVRHGDAIYR
jgi:hypothetical protein